MFTSGDYVFARMKGFPPWPGIVAGPPDLRSNKLWIFFFGSQNYSWVENENVENYFENKDRRVKTVKSAAFKKACRECDEHIAKGHSLAEIISVDPFDKLMSSEVSTSKRRKISVDDMDLKRRSKIAQPRLSTGGRPRKTVSLFPDSNSQSKQRARRLSTDKQEDKSVAFQDPSPSTSRISGSLLELLRTPILATPSVDSTTELTAFQMEQTDKNIPPSKHLFGFIGLGKMGSAMISNIISSNIKIIIANRTREKCEYLKETFGDKVKVAENPAEVVDAADITCVCVSDEEATREVVWNPRGVLTAMKTGKALVEMSGINSEMSQSVADAITSSGGRYLEVRFRGTRSNAASGTLSVLAAGDRALYDDCTNIFCAIATNKIFLGEVGKASTVNTLVNAHLATTLCIASEQAGRFWNKFENKGPRDRFGIYKELSNVIPSTVNSFAESYKQSHANPDMSLSDLKKDVSRSLNKANKHNLRTPMLASVMAQLNNCAAAGNASDDIGTVLFSYMK